MVRRFFTYFGLTIGGLFLVAVIALGAYVYSVSRGLPGVDQLKNYQPPVTTRVYASNGDLLGEYARERRFFVPIAFVPKLVIQAFTSAEDKNFFHHPGVDPSGIMRAAVKDVFNVLQHKRLEGASTITQQVAKNLLLNNQVKFSRKVREAILAVRLDSSFSKEKILELYLNEIFLGENSYGVAAAALNYFNKSLDQLDVAEAAFLAALPKAPANYDPRYNKQAALERRNWVISQMRENGYITREQEQHALAEPLVTQMRPLGIQAEDADYFVEEVRRLLYAKYGAKGLYDAGLQVRSTLDSRLQNFAVNALRAGLVRYDRRHGWRGAVRNISIDGDWKDALQNAGNHSGISTWRLAVVLGYTPDRGVRIGLDDGRQGAIPFDQIKWARPEHKASATVGPAPAQPQDVVKAGDVVYVEPVDAAGHYGLRQVPEINGAVVVMDPHTGRVFALSGGFSFASSQFDRAMQAQRQPGSAFKPFVYAAAMDNGYTPESKILDAPVAFPQGPGLPMWTPKNFEKHFLGLATLRRGIALSRNLMTIRLAHDVGMDKVVQYPIRMGVYDKLPAYLSNSIGAYETTLIRLTAGYAQFVNGGKKVSPILIDRIQDRNGKTIYRADNRTCDGCNTWNWHNQSEPLLPDMRQQTLDPRTAYQIVSLLQGVVQYGTGKVVSEVGKPLAGKTGTSNDSKDTWFVGFSPDLVCGVFVGFDDPRTLGRMEQGATTAAPVFRDFMKEALAGEPPIPFRVPPGIILVSVDRLTGEPANASPAAIQEAYKSGTEPGAASYLDQAAVQTDAKQPTGPGTTVDEGTGGLY
ncbi:MAG: penicillin-binding protein 1A [Alphaproteobacteria bacterium]|nr:penicillin-binding protein 1A [Alphaproteobacteria bacterium]MBV9063235.1 penicillin-binding protein 1A [Alphaproteobacteria bacterium]